jgi:hypothetical protein
VELRSIHHQAKFKKNFINQIIFLKKTKNSGTGRSQGKRLTILRGSGGRRGSCTDVTLNYKKNKIGLILKIIILIYF